MLVGRRRRSTGREMMMMTMVMMTKKEETEARRVPFVMDRRRGIRGQKRALRELLCVLFQTS